MALILGIDPGPQVTGYGLIRQGASLLSPDFGSIRPPKTLALGARYEILYNGIVALLDLHRPDALAIESQFISKENPQSGIKIGMVKGLVYLAAEQKKVPLFEYAPRQAKLAVTGSGQASKWQVQKMVQILLQLPSPPTPEDAADALALAICHSHHMGKHRYV